MFKSSYTLFNAFGIPIKVEASLFFLLIYLLLSSGNLMSGLVYAACLLGSILFHELAHSLVAVAFGGRVRDITLQFLGGCAAISEMPRRAWQELLMAAAGPASSFLLAFLAILAGLFGQFRHNSAAGQAVYMLALINIMLGTFNLLPAFPMDGGRMLRATLQFTMSKLRATWIASRIGRALALFMIVTSVLNFFDHPLPVPRIGGMVGDLLYYFLAGGGIFRFLIGIMIYQNAEAEYRMVQMESAAGGGPRGPFAGFPGFGFRREPPPDGDQAVISPPPYERRGGQRADVHRE